MKVISNDAFGASVQFDTPEIVAIARMIGETSEEERITRFRMTKEESDFCSRLYQTFAI